MNKDNPEAFMAFIGGFFAGCMMGAAVHFAFFGSTDVGVRQTRQEAIEAGVAEWRVDASTGETSFHWLSSEK